MQLKEIKQLLKSNNSHYYEFYDFAFPKKVRIPQWAWAADTFIPAVITHYIGEERNLKSSTGDQQSRQMKAAFYSFVEYGSQTYVMQPELLKALQRTGIKDNIDISELNWPFKSFNICLPKGAIDLKNEGEAAIIHLSDHIYEDKRMFLCAVFSSRGSSYSYCDFYENINLENLWAENQFKVEDFGLREKREALESDSDKVKLEFDHLYDIDKDNLRSCVVLGISALLFMNSCPTDVFHDGSIKKVKQKSKKGKIKDWVNPHYLGLDYDKRHRVVRTQGPGSGRKVAFHWRRGHWRKQPYGPKEERKHRIIWIEPFKVGEQ